ncbi:MAG TPA: ABC transporter permease [Dehalococcoidia bacterium]|nr:ABC transporter permease [Dehalococcoidia bacterium]
MQRYILRRLLMAALIVWAISVVVFVLLRVSPGDPALLQQGINATPEKIAAVHKQLGLDRPMIVQYFDWVGKLLHGDLGSSVLSQTSVTHEFRQRFPISLELMVLTVFWVVVIGIPLGMVSAIKRNSLTDYIARLLAIFGLSVPAFWVATLVLILPAQWWGYAPPLGRQIALFSDPAENLRQFLPASLVLALGPIAAIMRLTRSSMLEVLRQDYVRTARAKGLREQAVVFGHVLKNSLVPVITVLGLLTAGLLGGSVIIEQIFALRGIGQYIFMSLLQKDFPVAQGLVMYTAAVVVLINLVVDISYAVLDPRIRYA